MRKWTWLVLAAALALSMGVATAGGNEGKKDAACQEASSCCCCAKSCPTQK